MALLIILSQIGCFVPAHYAVIPVRDRLLSRIGMADDMEHNLSTFHTEMKECSYILENITPKSLSKIVLTGMLSILILFFLQFSHNR